jgi:hypothetical protein
MFNSLYVLIVVQFVVYTNPLLAELIKTKNTTLHTDVKCI